MRKNLIFHILIECYLHIGYLLIFFSETAIDHKKAKNPGQSEIHSPWSPGRHLQALCSRQGSSNHPGRDVVQQAERLPLAHC